MKRLRLIYVFLTVLAAAMLYGSGLGWAQVEAGPCTTERVYGNKIKVFYNPANNCAVTQVCFDFPAFTEDCSTPLQAEDAVICDCAPLAGFPNACDAPLTAQAGENIITCNAVQSTSPPQGCPVLGSAYYMVGGDAYRRP